MSTRDQIRASKAHQYITAHKSKEEKWRKEYTNMARGTSALIHASGLAQALEFIATRGESSKTQMLTDLDAVVKASLGFSAIIKNIGLTRTKNTIARPVTTIIDHMINDHIPSS